MLDQGIALAPGAYEALFSSLAHTSADLERTVEAAAIAAGLLVEAAG
jgi:glutamate-1-semialdehyde 2,1-aminomutase